MEIKEVQGDVYIAQEGNVYVDMSSVTFSKYIHSLAKGINYHVSSTNPFAYDSSAINFYGRTKDIQTIESFLNSDNLLQILTITGPGGSGKSRLVYNIVKNHQSDINWSMVYLPWNDFSASGLDISINDFSHDRNIVLILDNVLGYTDKIGTWIAKLNHLSGTITKGTKIRIIIIERENISHSSKVFWYNELIEKNNLQNLCFWTSIDLTPLDDDDYVQIALNYMTYLRENSSNNIEYMSSKKIMEQIVNPFKEAFPGSEYPLYLLYMTDCYIKEKTVNVSKLTELCCFINNNDKNYLMTIVNNNSFAYELICNLLTYATAVGTLNLSSKTSPDFLAADVKELVTYAKTKQTNVKSLCDMINSNKTTLKDVLIYPKTPDIMGEFFTLDYLEEYKLDNLDYEYIDHYLCSAWNHNPESLFEFLVRIINDFPDHPLVNTDCLLKDYECIITNPKNYSKYLKLLDNLMLSSKNTELIDSCITRIITLDECNKDNEEALVSYAIRISWLIDECDFDDNIEHITDADKTNYLNILDKLSCEHSDNQDIILAYANGLYHYIHSGKLDSIRLEHYTNIIDKLLVNYDNNCSILQSLSYTYLDTITKHHSSLDKLNYIYKLFPTNNEIVYNYANGIYSQYNSYHSDNDKIDCVEQIKDIYSANTSNARLRTLYSDILLEITYDIDDANYSMLCANLQDSLLKAEPENENIALNYAETIKNAICDQDDSHSFLFDTLYDVAKSYPNNNYIWLVYGSSLLIKYNTSNELEYKTACIDELNRLYNSSDVTADISPINISLSDCYSSDAWALLNDYCAANLELSKEYANIDNERSKRYIDEFMDVVSYYELGMTTL